MSDSPAQRLNAVLEGRYSVQHELGEGGMATVYLARDLKHNRSVALKVLKPELAAVVGAERFLAEIETTANLQHPHILPLFDSGEADGFLFYVMPYVEGETLAERLEREQQLSVDEALRITRAVAGALDYAHRQGVVHRDIKPANILLHEGEPLVADFGIALAVSQAGDGRITETGLSLGTPHYMSPEQAAGERTLDKRSDVYALGCVLYQMLTGQPPFGGSNAQAVLGRILTGEPDPVTEHRRSVPPNVEAAVHKALERLPADRFEGAGAFVEALDDPGFTTTVGTVTRGAAVAEARWRRRFMATAVAAVLLLAAAVAGWLRSGRTAPERLVRFSQPLSVNTDYVGAEVAPDGSGFVYLDGTSGEMWLRELDEAAARPLEAEARQATFSPDGRSLAVTTPDGELRVHPLEGGPSRTLTQAGSGVHAAWGTDGFVYFAFPGARAVGRIPEGGGPADTLLVADEGQGYDPQLVLPGGRGLLYERFTPGDVGLFLLDPESGESSRISTVDFTPSRSVAYSPMGYLLYSSGRYLLAHPFDPRALEFTGDPVPVAEVRSGSLQFAYGSGTLVYSEFGGTGDLVPAIVNRAGEQRALSNLGEGGFDYPEVSPSGDRIALQVTNRGEGDDVWVYEMPAGPLTRLSLEGGVNATTWSLDGEDIFFLREGDAYRTRSDGSEPPVPVLDLDRNLARLALGPDGRRLYYQVGAGQWDIGVVTVDEEGSDSLVLDAGYFEGHPDISPDGRWLAYYSTESGEPQVYVRPLHGPGRKHQVSIDGGLRPRWSHDGTELFFASGLSGGNPSLSAARVEVGEEDLDVVDVRRFFDLRTYNYDVFPGDSLFVVLVPGQDDQDGISHELAVVVNFDRLLRELENGGGR